MFSSNTSQVAATATQAEAVDFDGTNDYLSRTSTLTGAANSKTFTLSFWFWAPLPSTDCTFYEEDTGSSYRFVVEWIVSSTTLRVYARNTSGTNILVANYQIALGALTNTFYHILFSADLSSTSNRYFYVNDEAVAPSYATYTNQEIGFANSTRYAVANDLINTGLLAKTRLSNFYRDNTYRDLSITANRRLFITADLKPAAGQSALNPILYLPMSDPTTVGTNAGTGGNFTLTGTVARSGRGPNQYNAPYSDLDGTADYLSRASLSGIADGKQFTFACCFNADSFNNKSFLDINTGSSTRFHIRMTGTTGAIQVIASNSSGTTILNFYSEPFDQLKLLRNYVMVVSGDMNDSSTFKISVNGEFLITTLGTYSNDTIDFTNTNTVVGRDLSLRYFDGRLGGIWFNTSYIDLSVASNLAKFVSGIGIDAKPVDLGATGELPTGTSPLIYLPMYGNNAGKNYGTGGDFTVNSGPYTGARGPNEFFENKAVFNGSTGYLSASSTSMTASKTFTFVIRFNRTTAKNQYPFSIGGGRFVLYWDSADNVVLAASNSAGTQVLNVSLGTAGSTNPYLYLISVDLSSTSLRSVYRAVAINNPTSLAATWNTYTNDSIDFTRVSSTNRTSIGTIYSGSPSTYMAGYVSLLYFSTQYTDFSVEANRLKFIDCFGYATDIPAQITAGNIPNPPILMRFDPASFGTNSGTDGNFTVSGTITDGGQL